MAKTVKDVATAEQAARRLNEGVERPAIPGEPVAPKSTAENLFPEFVTDDGGIINRPIRAFEDKAKTLPATVTPAAKPEGVQASKPGDAQNLTQSTQPPTAPVYLKTDELTGKMVKIKVDGVESDVPAESLVKNFQLERHLNVQLMNLAEERRKLEMERTQALTRLTPPDPTKPVKQDPPKAKSAEVEVLEGQIAAMNAQMQALVTSLQPQIQDSGLKRLDQRVKDTLGATDFLEYAPKIKEWALNESAKYQSGSPQSQYFDSADTWYAKYQEMKIKELMAKPQAAAPAPNPQAPVLQTPQGAPVIINSQGQPVSIPAIEPSGGVSRGLNPNGDWQTRAQQAFEQARQAGTTEAWMHYYKLKSEA